MRSRHSSLCNAIISDAAGETDSASQARHRKTARHKSFKPPGRYPAKQARRQPRIFRSRTSAGGFCAARGWDVVIEFTEPGASGLDGRRPELQRLLDMATQGRAAVWTSSTPAGPSASDSGSASRSMSAGARTGMKRPATQWAKPGIIGRVNHLRGKEDLRHACLQDFREEDRADPTKGD